MIRYVINILLLSTMGWYSLIGMDILERKARIDRMVENVLVIPDMKREVKKYKPGSKEYIQLLANISVRLEEVNEVIGKKPARL